MNTFLVTYDLQTPGKDYTALRKFIQEQYDYWAKPVESVYLIKTNETAESLRDRLLGIDRNDKVFVVDVTDKTAAWSGLSKEVSDWIKTNL